MLPLIYMILVPVLPTAKKGRTKSNLAGNQMRGRLDQRSCLSLSLHLEREVMPLKIECQLHGYPRIRRNTMLLFSPPSFSFTRMILLFDRFFLLPTRSLLSLGSNIILLLGNRLLMYRIFDCIPRRWTVGATEGNRKQQTHTRIPGNQPPPQ